MTLYMTLSSSCRGLRVPRKMPCRPGNVLLAKSAALPSPARYQSSEARPRDPGLKPSPPTSPPDESRLPAWAAKYAYRFKNNPASHVTSFLILHELTAVLPLPILFWFFHSFDWTPEKYIEKGVKAAGKQLERWGLRYTGDDGSRYIFEGAAAYAVVKLFLPLRIALSLSLTPLFARRVVVPITGFFRRKIASKPSDK